MTERHTWVYCKICGNPYRILAPHLKTHGLTLSEYEKLFPEALTYGRDIYESRMGPKDPIPNPTEPITSSYPFSPIGNDRRIKCEVCGSYLYFINYSHLKSHGMTRDQYIVKYPNSPLYSDNLREQVSMAQRIRDPRSEETSRLISENNRRRWADPVTKMQLSIAIRESQKDPEFRKRRSEISKENWKDPEYVKKTMEGKNKACRHISEPNKEEMQFHFWVDSLRPGKVMYNREYIPEVRLTPDFLVIGEKKAIEYFGTYYHDPYSGIQKDEYFMTEEDYHKRYEEAGYRLLIIWGDEVYLEETRVKLEEFIDSD